MNRILYIFFLLIPFTAFAQEEEDTFSPSKLESIEKNMKLIWDDPDPAFKVSAPPSKWSEESAVIIAQKTKFSFDKDASKLAVFEITRRRIRLNDKDAVNNYSSVYFRIGSSYDGAGIRITKLNGEVKNVSLKNAVYVEDPSTIPSIFTPYIGKQSTYYDKSKSRIIYYKVAVPDLDPGDIIDYGTIFYDDNTVKKMSFLEFDPIYFVCTREYPVMSQKFEIDTDNNSFVNSKSTKGAPEFKESGNPNSDYIWEDSDREKISDTRWVNRYVELPMVKFQIVFSKTENRSDLFIGDRGELKKQISPDELAKKMNNLHSRLDGSFNYNLAKAYLRQLGYSDMRDDDFIQKTYYILRHISFYRSGGFSSEMFASCFTQCLDLKKIPYELIVTTPTTLTRPENIIFRSEPEWLIRVKGKYIFNATHFSNPYDIPEEYLEAPAYIVSLGKNPTATLITLPGTKADENVVTNTVTATIDTSSRIMHVTLQRVVSGLCKQYYNRQALAYTTALDDDHRSYGGEDDVRNGMKGASLDSYEERLRERKKEDQQKKPEFMKSEFEDFYDNITRYTKFTLNADGRTFKKQDLNYTNVMELGGTIKISGNNLLVAVPSLIGDQTFIGSHERQREVDAYLGFPESVRNVINFTIPEGFTVVGLPALNVNVDNGAGTFATQATVEGNKLTILVKKIWKSQVVDQKNWPDLMQMLDAAYNFSQKKVLLKRK